MDRDERFEREFERDVEACLEEIRDFLISVGIDPEPLEDELLELIDDIGFFYDNDGGWLLNYNNDDILGRIKQGL